MVSKVRLGGKSNPALESSESEIGRKPVLDFDPNPIQPFTKSNNKE